VKVLIINLDSVGEGMGLGVRAAKAGHQVKIWMSKENHKETGLGFKHIERVENWLAEAKWADLIVPTGNHEFMPKLDSLKKMGFPIFGPSVRSAALEVKRALGMAFFEKHGIEVPPYEEFATLEAARAHVMKTGERYVFKTLGDEDDKSLSYVAKSAADMVARLDRWQRLKMNPKGAVMLQTFVPGVEMGVSRWMGKDGFVGPYNENFEFKKLLSGDAGPNCGEAGTVLKYVATSKLGTEVLAPLEEALVELGHLGDIDVNCIVNEQGQALPLEFTMRLGWPAANIMWGCHKDDPVEWMLDACHGIDSLEVRNKVACGVVIAQPDYPYSKATKAELDGIPIYGVTPKNEGYLSPQAVKIETLPQMEGENKVTEKPMWCTTGDYICVVSGQGSTVRRATERAYGTLKELHIPNMIYRDDIGEKLKEELPKLQAHGYATEFKYGEDA
jgi:phosphoribosylamine--glycine ligase